MSVPLRTRPPSVPEVGSSGHNGAGQRRHLDALGIFGTALAIDLE